MTNIVIHAHRLVVGRDNIVFTPGSIVVDEDRIRWSGSTNDDAVARHLRTAQRVLDLPGTTLLPGLIDAHTHITFGATAVPPRDPRQTAVNAAAELLSVGVTTIRDLGAPRAVNTADLPVPGPRVLTAGVPLTSRQGHCHTLGGAVTRNGEIDRLIAFNAEHGARWIKVMVTGGFTSGGSSSPYTPQFTDRQLDTIVRTARRHEMPVAAHAHGTEGIRQAINAGVDSIEHCTWMTPDGFNLNLHLVDRLAQRRIPVCPTLNHAARQATGRLPWAVRLEHLRIMLDAGVRLLAGSDSGIPNSPHHLFPQSLSAYADLGMDPIDVIETATGHNADALRIGDLTGTLTPGKYADIIAVSGDPTTDLTAITNPVMVMAAGRIHHLKPAIATDARTERPLP